MLKKFLICYNVEGGIVLNLLIADDNRDLSINIFNSIMKNQLDNVRIQGIVTNGLEAYQKIKDLNPDLVLLDIQMPILNGFQVINKLIDEHFKLPKIILITSFPELINTFTKSNIITNIFVKPFDITQLNKYLIE